MNKPKVSIIVPVYNAEEYLPETLRALSAQSFTDFEMFFVDDGSSDRSLELIRSFAAADSRAHLLQQQHQYAGVARNNGMKHAQGEYLLFLDADDFFHPDMLEKAVARADETQADICVFKADQYNQKTGRRSKLNNTCDTRLCPKRAETFSRHSNSANIFRFTTGAPWNKLFRRSFVEANGLVFQDIQSANDVAFTMTALAVADRIAILDEVLLTYRANNASSLQGSKYKNPDSFFKARYELKKRLEERQIYGEVQQAFVNYALHTSVGNLKTMRTREGFEKAYELLKNTAFRELDLLRWPKSYFYNTGWNSDYAIREEIMSMTVTEFEKWHRCFGMREDASAYKGKRLLQLSRTVGGGVQCLRDHGVGYTVRRTLYHLGLWEDEEASPPAEARQR